MSLKRPYQQRIPWLRNSRAVAVGLPLTILGVLNQSYCQAVAQVRQVSQDAPQPAVAEDKSADRNANRNSIEALFVPERANDVTRHAVPNGAIHVSYRIEAAHPAEKFIRRLSTHLEERGWEPLQMDWLNPATASSHIRGWGEFIDATMTPPRKVHQWKAQWQDPAGKIVDYTLRYSYPRNGKPDRRILWVNASWNPVQVVQWHRAGGHVRPSLLYAGPVLWLLVGVFGAVVAIVRWKRHPRVSGLILAALALLFLSLLLIGLHLFGFGEVTRSEPGLLLLGESLLIAGTLAILIRAALAERPEQ